MMCDAQSVSKKSGIGSTGFFYSISPRDFSKINCIEGLGLFCHYRTTMVYYNNVERKMDEKIIRS